VDARSAGASSGAAGHWGTRGGGTGRRAQGQEERGRVNDFLRQLAGPREGAVLAWHLLEALAVVPDITERSSASRSLAAAVLFLEEQSRGVRGGQRSPDCCLFLGEVYLLLAEEGTGAPGDVSLRVEGAPGEVASGEVVFSPAKGAPSSSKHDADGLDRGTCEGAHAQVRAREWAGSQGRASGTPRGACSTS